ncbi:MAG: PmoA family protein [Planctomycetales bacterium]|nr:PmoA family protein [Planctomycetales bacterium]
MKFRSYANLMPCLLILALAALSSLAHAGEKVEFLKTDSTLHITIDGQPFATYNFSHEQMKPFLLPIQTQSGVMVNRSLNDASDADHPHHKGVWNSVDEINGIKFWREDGPIRNIAVRVIQAGGPLGIFEVINQWQHPETGEPQLTETAIVTIHANRLLVYDMLFTASHVAADFEDTKEGMFGIRVAPSMKEKNGGHVVASDGSETTQNCWGKSFPWIDYSGTVDGKTVGVAIMDHPNNFRASRYHVRDYGLFSISPFGNHAYTNGVEEAAPVHLAKNESLRLRYGMYFHDGDPKEGNVAAAWDQFVKSTAE